MGLIIIICEEVINCSNLFLFLYTRTWHSKVKAFFKKKKKREKKWNYIRLMKWGFITTTIPRENTQKHESFPRDRKAPSEQMLRRYWHSERCRSMTEYRKTGADVGWMNSLSNSTSCIFSEGSFDYDKILTRRCL